MRLFGRGVVVAGMVAGVAATSGVAQAQYVGPGATPVHQTVAAVLESGRDDQDVVLRGILLKKVGSDKYLFADQTGQIRVEIDHKDFPSQPISDTTRVEVRGEVEADFLQSPEIDVKRLTVLPDGE